VRWQPRCAALVTAGLAAILIGVPPTIRRAAVVQAAGSVIGAIGCANSNSNLDIQFPTVGATATASGTISSSIQVPVAGLAPATFNAATPGQMALCGAAFQDSNTAGSASGFPLVVVGGGPGATDGDPNTIDGGTITYTLTTGVSSGGSIATILESNSITASINCGGAQPPTVAAGPPPFVPVETAGSLETCEGAVPSSAYSAVAPINLNPAVSPNIGNTVHVALRAGVTFGLFGAGNSSIGMSATYTRFPSLNVAGAAPSVTASTLTTDPAVFAFATPSYALALAQSAATVTPAGNTTGAPGAVITATLSRFLSASNLCVPAATPGLFTCGTPNGTTANANAGVFQNLAGAEPGVVTFTTTNGSFGQPPGLSGPPQQVVSVHCGASAGAASLPQAAGAYGINNPSNPNSVGTVPAFASCNTVSATLYGSSVAGVAAVTAQFIGEVTGATANNITNVPLTAIGPATPLGRGYNQVTTPASMPPNTPTAVVAALVQGSTVVGIFQYNNGRRLFEAGYFALASAPVDFTTTGPARGLFICVSGPATFPSSSY